MECWIISFTRSHCSSVSSYLLFAIFITQHNFTTSIGIRHFLLFRYALIEPEPCCGHLNFECSSLSANQRFQHIYDLAILNVGGIGKLLAVLFPHGFEFPAALDVVQNGGHIRNLTSCAAMGCSGV